MKHDDALPALPIGEAEVLWHEPDPVMPERPGKIIDASHAFMDAAPLGTRLYSAEQMRAYARQAVALWKLSAMAQDDSGHGPREDSGMNRFTMDTRRSAIEAAEGWRKWIDRIPAIPMPAGWRVQMLPPYAGALARFAVVNLAGQHKSVYLDVWERLGFWDGGPYWEVYPVDNDVARCDMNDVAELIRLIEAPRGDEGEDMVERNTGEPAGPLLLTGQIDDGGRTVKHDDALPARLSDDEILRLWQGGSVATRPVIGSRKVLDFARAVEQRVLAALAAREGEPAVAVISECEACFTPDVCQLRGKCDYYAADRLRVAAAPTPPAEAVSAQREAMLDAMCHAEDHTPSKPDGTTYSQREYMALLLDAALAARDAK